MTDQSARTSAFSDASLPERYERLLAPSLFEPWATVLLDAVGLTAGDRVLDVAAGTGVVSRAAARRAGPGGRVVSSDISPAMIAFNATHPAEDGCAPITTVVASVTDLDRDVVVATPEDVTGFDVVLCQQGMPFFPDRPGALREMRRVLRPGGRLGLAVWTPGHQVVPFGQMNSALREIGVPEPFPGAYDDSSFVLSAEQVADLLTDTGWHEIQSREVELRTHWTDVATVVAAVHGTPFGPLLDALDPDSQRQARALMTERLAVYERGGPNGPVEIPTYSVIATATA